MLSGFTARSSDVIDVVVIWSRFRTSNSFISFVSVGSFILEDGGWRKSFHTNDSVPKQITQVPFSCSFWSMLTFGGHNGVQLRIKRKQDSMITKDMAWYTPNVQHVIMVWNFLEYEQSLFFSLCRAKSARHENDHAARSRVYSPH